MKKFYNKKANILKIKNKNKINEKVPEKKMKLKKLFDINEHNSKNNFENINYLGAMTFECSHCSAKFWKFEKRKSNCCQNGKIRLSPLSEYDNNLKDLLMYDDDFRNFIRYYNNLFCFASFNANVIHDRKKAIYNLKIQGQVCHKTPNSLLCGKNKKPSCGQLYIYDDLTSI